MCSAIGPGFKPNQYPLAGMWKSGLTAMLANKKLAGVTPEVKLGEHVTCMPPLSANKVAHPGFENQRCHQKCKTGVFH